MCSKARFYSILILENQILGGLMTIISDLWLSLKAFTSFCLAPPSGSVARMWQQIEGSAFQPFHFTSVAT